MTPFGMEEKPNLGLNSSIFGLNELLEARDDKNLSGYAFNSTMQNPVNGQSGPQLFMAIPKRPAHEGHPVGQEEYPMFMSGGRCSSFEKRRSPSPHGRH